MRNILNEEIVIINGFRFRIAPNGQHVPLDKEDIIDAIIKNRKDNSDKSNKKISFEKYRQLIIKEHRNEKNDLYNLTKEIIRKTSYRKNEVKKQEVYLPMPTQEMVLKDKSINMRTYGAMMLKSNWGGMFLNPDDRYIYSDKLNNISEEVASELQIRPTTLKRYLTSLKKCKANIFQPTTNKKGELIYRLKYTDEYLRGYTLIHEKALRKLIEEHRDNALKIYLVMLYKCFAKMDKDSGKIEYKECEITQEYLCESIGLMPNSRKIVAKCIELLERDGFIKVRSTYKTNYETKNGKVLNYPIPKYFYSISKNY